MLQTTPRRPRRSRATRRRETSSYEVSMLGEQVNLSAGFAQHVTVKINSPLRRETRCAMRCPTRSRSRLSSASVASTRDLSSSLPGCIMHTHIEYTYAVTAQSQERRRGGGRGVSARAGLRHRKCAAAEKDAEDIKKAARAAGSNSGRRTLCVRGKCVDGGRCFCKATHCDGETAKSSVCLPRDPGAPRAR